MFTYDEIIELNKYYCPYYNLLDETEDYWKSFIPTSQFYMLLRSVLDSFDSEGLSIWLQGAYGTGKSHATGFIKHLLFLPWDSVSNIVENFHDTQLKHRLIKFRENNCIFPVIMYGADKITNQIDFALQLEIGVRKAFDLAGIHLTTKTDFEEYIDTIEKDNSNYWETLIEDSFEIRELARNKEELVQKLKLQDQDIFLVLRDELNRRNRPISVRDIVKWLSDVAYELQEQGIANQVFIYWDEFTTILDKNKSEIHEYIQRIAESSSSSRVRLYLISHRTVLQGTRKEDRNKLLGRFIDVTYEMSDITTYLLMANAINKKDYESWIYYRDQKNDIISNVISKIGQYEADEALEDIRNLFPIHPYSAYISSYIARVMGSTERSIFDFLNNQTSGFKYFIGNFPGKDRIEYLTVDYVFDFFQKVFEEQSDPFFVSVLQKLHYNYDVLKRENEYFPAIFKNLLMMNIAHHKINVGTDNNRMVIPNKENLIISLAGTHLENTIEAFLGFIDLKKIIIKDHSNRYIVDAANFDMSEIEEWKTMNRSKFRSIDEIFITDYQIKLFKPLKTSHRRKDVTKVILLDAEYADHQIKRKISKEFSDDYCLNIILIIARNLDHYNQILNNIPNIIQESDIPICFVVLDKIFLEEDMERYLDFKSRAEVSHNKHDSEAEDTARKNTEGHLNQWVTNAVDNGIVRWFVKDKESTLVSGISLFPDFSKVLNTTISQVIFYSSFDTLYPKLKVETAWNSSLTMKSAENFLMSDNLVELSQKMKAAPMNVTLEILSDMNGSLLVKNNLKIEHNITEHPLIIIRQKLENRLSGKEVVNLIEVMEFLFKPPFGFYQNHIFLAVVGFVLRKYRGKFYAVNTGELCSEIKLLEMIEKVFKYFCQNRFNYKNDLNVRIGSENETRLVKLIEEMFKLSPCDSIVDTRHKLYDWLTTNLKIPLWLLQYSKTMNEDVQIGINIIGTRILNFAVENFLSLKDFADIYSELSAIKSEIMTLLNGIDEEKREEIFENYIKQDLDFIAPYYKVNHYTELMDYLQMNLQSDPIYWEENNVKSIIQKWYFSKMETPGSQPEEQTHTEEGLTPDKTKVPTISKQEAISLIENYQGDLHQVLIELIDNNSYLIDIVYQLLGGKINEEF